MTKLNSTGQTLVEMAIGIGIISVSIVAISSFIAEQHKSNVRVTNMDSCRTFAESIINDFSDSSGVNIKNYIPGSSGAVSTVVAPRVEQNYYTVNAQGQFRNFQNLENAITRAFQIYKGDATYCTTFKPLLRSILNNPTIIDTMTGVGYTASIQFVPFNLLTAAPLACGGAWDIRPYAGANGGNIPPNPSNYGIKLKVMVANAVSGQQCSAEKLLTYNADSAQPTTVADDAPWPAFLSSCSTGDYYASLGSSEPGSIFLCDWDGTPVTFTSPLCHTSAPPEALTAQTLAVSNPGLGQSNTLAILHMTGLSTTFTHTLHVMAVDTASNVSNATKDISVDCNCTVSSTCSGPTTLEETISGCVGPPDASWTWVSPRVWTKTGGGLPCTGPVGPCTGTQACSGGALVCSLTASPSLAWVVSGGACVCAPGYTFTAGACVPTLVCSPGSVSASSSPASDTGVANCAAANKTCAADGLSWGAWTCTGCAAGYTLSGGACLAGGCSAGDTQGCSGADPHANYSQSCVAGAWGPCTCTGCSAGYTGVCGSCAAAATGACGPSAGGTFLYGSPPVAGLCSSGTASAVTRSAGQFRWTCDTGVPPISSCTANVTYPPNTCAADGVMLNKTSFHGGGWSPMPGSPSVMTWGVHFVGRRDSTFNFALYCPSGPLDATVTCTQTIVGAGPNWDLMCVQN